MKGHIIDENDNYKDIGLSGFDYKLFEKEEGGGTRKGLDSYPYLKHLIQLCTDDWVKQMAKMNKAVGMKNRVTMIGGGKWLVILFKSQEFWKFIGCILSPVTYGKKGHKIWSEVPKCFGKYENTKLRRDVNETTDLYKVCCDHYRQTYSNEIGRAS